MRIAELADRIAADVRKDKERWLKLQRQPDADTNMRSSIHGYRGENPVVMLMPFQVDRDKALYAAWMAASFFACDTLAITTESWRPADGYVDRDPYTGKTWSGREHSMQQAVEQWYAREEGIILDCLMTQVVNRAGDIAMVNQDYRISRRVSVFGIADFTVEWLGESKLDTFDARAKTAGIIPDALRRFMNEPSMVQRFAAMGLSGDKFGLDDVETMAHADCGAVRALLAADQWDGGVVLMSDDPRRSEIIHRSLGHLPNVLREDESA